MPQNPPAQVDAARSQRAQAFAVARRHSGRVRFFRIAIVAAAILGVAGLVTVSLLDPFRILPAGVSISSAGLSGTKVTMAQPKLTGFRKDGRAYAVNAESSVQDIRDSTTMDLFGVNAQIVMGDKSKATISAPRGVYNTQKEQMVLSGEVHMRNDAGYDLEMKTGLFDFKASELASKDPVVLTMTNGTVNADSMRIVENGQRIIFEGNVVSVMKAAPQSPATIGLKGNAQ